jgi:hypothetical protein
MSKHRYEILLPAEFNDGRLVADACPRCVPDSLAEVIDSFGALDLSARTPRWAAGPRTGHRNDDRL